LRQEKFNAAIAKDQYERDIAILQQALDDKTTELSDNDRDHGMHLNHYRTGADITRRFTADLETRIVELDDLVSTMQINAILNVEPMVAEHAVIDPIIVEPIAIPVNNTLPHGYYFVAFTSVVSGVSYPVVRGPHSGYHTMRSAFVLKRMSATQVANMIPT
jgi:hypothetical protein